MTDREKLLARLSVDFKELQKGLAFVRLRQHFAWTGTLEQLISNIILLLQEPRPAPSPDDVQRGRQPIENPGPLPEHPQHPTSKEILSSVLSHSEDVFRSEKKP